jgi:hypothetical protein
VSAPGCPGVSEYGHGSTATTVHAGDCCRQWRERIIGYVDGLGYLHCVECAAAVGTPMRADNLASDTEECDGCHKRLVSA